MASKIRKSLSGFPDRKIEEPEPVESSSDEETNPQNEQPVQSTPKIETNEPSTSQDESIPSRQIKRYKGNQIGMDKTQWFQR